MRINFEYPSVAKNPAWGSPSSKANFCEEDYLISGYFAEFVNTITNTTYILYAIYGIRSHYRKNGAFMACLPYVGLAGVGVCSWYFHMVLNYYAQMSDDLSMFFCTGIVLYRITTSSLNPSQRLVMGVALSLSLGAISWYHVISNESLVHPVTFGLMINIVGLKTRAIIRERISDRQIRRAVHRLELSGAVSFISGFILWVIDRLFCERLKHLRSTVGVPWGFLLELHGWWHILTGIGAYIFIVLIEYLTSETVGKDPRGLYAWPVDLCLRSTGSPDQYSAIANRTTKLEMNGPAIERKNV
ncbi:alkaline phytoceramidase [Viridothelium virens]|uniref:Alkaline phytoceramidase n=1 Tax=Viridothelium virens TaxID=1048519 RepID=A0A6A6GW94_VIRVR|nr:alkaline phytoceramidase [Viridothelium virens]